MVRELYISLDQLGSASFTFTFTVLFSKSVLVMNIMILVWTLSFLILSYTLGFPMLNSTSESHMETFPNVTESNSTEYINTNLTNRIRKRPSARRGCFLSTCSLWNLGSKLQAGNEIAGDMTSDPMGIGKK